MRKYLQIGACLIACLMLAAISPYVGLFAVAIVLAAYAFGVFDAPATFTHEPGPEPVADGDTIAPDDRYIPPAPNPLPAWHAPLTSVLERCKPLDIIKRICGKTYDADPLLTAEQTRMAGIINSAVRDHGKLIETAIRESLKSHPEYLVWDEPNFRLSHGDTNYHKAVTVEGSALAELPYGDGDAQHRPVQVDLITFEKSTGIVRAYEIKRNHLDTGSTTNLQIVRSLLVSYARTVKQLPATKAEAYTISYYANPSKAAGRLTSTELKKHFGVDVCADVDKATGAYRAALQASLAPPVRVGANDRRAAA